jgi:putative membrane protein
MGWGHMQWGWSGGLMTIIWIFLVVSMVYWVFQRKQRNGGASGSESAIEILKKRYARGEISKEQFEQMKKDLL